MNPLPTPGIDATKKLPDKHGIGIAKKRWWPLAVSKEARDLHRAIKLAVDPKAILNPGKFV
jgi:glycolate oxidase